MSNLSYRDVVTENYINKNGYPNSKIIDGLDEKYFDFFKFEQIPKGLALADGVVKDENGDLKYCFLKHFDGEEMRLITGYTGSGKSLRYLLQNLMVAVAEGQSAIVTDISGQLLEYSYDLLKKYGVEVKVLNFSNCHKSDTYNPFYLEAKKCLAAKKMTDSTIEFIDYISLLIIHSESKDPSWSMGARSVIKGLIYGMFEELLEGTIKPEDITIYNLVQQFYWVRDQAITRNSIAKLSEIDYYAKKDRFSKSIQLLSAIVENAPVTRAGYFGVVTDNLSEINNSVMFGLTSSSTIELSDLWKKQTVLFINTGGKTSGDVLTGIIVNRLYQEALEASNQTLSKHLDRPIQIFLDEFANVSFGDILHFEKMLTTTRKMQIFFNMFIQNYTQLKRKFGEYGASTITSNSTEIFLGTKDYESRVEFARSCGQRTVETLDSIYHNGEPKLISVPLITAEDLLKMPKGTMFIVRNGSDIIRTRFVPAYECEMFQQNLNYQNEYCREPYDYEANMIIQPLMIHSRTSDYWTKEKVQSELTEMDTDFLQEFISPNYNLDKIMIKKYLKLGLLKPLDDGKYVLTIAKELIEDVEEKKKPFFWDD